MFYDNRARAAGQSDPGLPWNPFKALVAPRPIGWISTIGADGTVNLAPFSYFQAVADRPDVVMFSAASLSAARGDSFVITDERKDTQQHAIAVGEFVVNLASDRQREAINQTSAHVPIDCSEAELAGLELEASHRVRPPRVAAAPAALECVVVGHQPVPTSTGDHRFHLVFGEVVGTWIDDHYVTDEGRVDTASMRLLTRLGYDEYAVLERTFRMTRPDLDTVQAGIVR